jgi:hypothetical protein
MALGSADILRNSGFAFNPATGKYEQAYARTPIDAFSDYTDYSFDPTGRQSLAGWAPGYYTDNGQGGFKSMFTEGLPWLGLAAAGAYGASALGAGAMGGAEAAGAAGAGATGSAAASGAAAGGAETGGAGMWDWLDDVGMDEFGNTGGEFTGGSSDFFDPMAAGGSMMPAAVPEADPTFGGTLTDVGNGSFEDIGSADLAARNMGVPTNLLSRLGDAALVQRLLGGGRSAAAGGTGGGAGGGMGLGDMAFNSAPFLLAAYMANQQRNDINPYIDRLNSLNDRFAGNESPYIKSLTDPYDMSTAQQRGTLTMGLGNRGVLGSSFGDNALDNFGYMRDVGRGNLTAQAINQSVGAQSQLTDQAIKGVNVRNANTNALLGAGLNASAKLFSPQRDPFGLSEILKLAGGG